MAERGLEEPADRWTNRLTDNDVSQKERLKDRQRQKKTGRKSELLRQTDRQNNLDKPPDWQTKLQNRF